MLRHRLDLSQQSKAAGRVRCPSSPRGPGHAVQLPWLLGTQWAQPGVEVTTWEGGSIMGERREVPLPWASVLHSAMTPLPVNFGSGPQDVLCNLSSYMNLTSCFVEGSQCSPSVRPPITQFGFQLHIIISSISNCGRDQTPG